MEVEVARKSHQKHGAGFRRADDLIGNHSFHANVHQVNASSECTTTVIIHCSFAEEGGFSC